ncbi:MAG: D-glycerate dehydrogenase [Armatimonadota bacterium]|nr:D-glycerate dehydrogenase [Armatimonadota bacterium]
MDKPRVFVTRRIPEEGIAVLERMAEVTIWTDELPPPHEILLREVMRSDGLLCMLTDKIDIDVMDAGPNLKVISNYAVGVDNIDVQAATDRGIAVGNTPGVLTETTADLAFALLLATARRIVEADKYLRACGWRAWGPTLFLGQDAHNATLGIVGMGRIGREMARRAKGFSMPILYTNPSPSPEVEEEFGAKRVSLDDLLRQSDFVSIHTPLTPETRHLISEREFDLMKPTAILINTARGPIVDQKALYQALSNGKIAGAGLDVFEEEPVDCGDPLLALDNVVAVPHIGSASVATRTKMAVMAAENIIAGLKSEPLPHPVNTVSIPGGTK